MDVIEIDEHVCNSVVEHSDLVISRTDSHGKNNSYGPMDTLAEDALGAVKEELMALVARQITSVSEAITQTLATTLKEQQELTAMKQTLLVERVDDIANRADAMRDEHLEVQVSLLALTENSLISSHLGLTHWFGKRRRACNCTTTATMCSTGQLSWNRYRAPFVRRKSLVLCASLLRMSLLISLRNHRMLRLMHVLSLRQ